ncbi:PDDEXK nuclease domain-containing protein [Methanoplanus limicola]|uniref:Cytoplasmic protein n=1 Tax=Methanoplanus limicola DSM 2279 TaxID=937775 RepID=H1YYM8_9EURY|nr:PDDEXK nuclease domain-containing protein [Methanoplanus limicola]EHQ36011.1 protein of unknown function DUF1016 [Methanoplanus limicola DSM 2279]
MEFIENNSEREINFSKLVEIIQSINYETKKEAFRAVNISLTLRNWCIGAYISDYELNGSDRAQYGDRLLPELSKNLEGVSNCNKRQLYRYIRFYRLYPQIVGTVSPQFKGPLKTPFFDVSEKVGTVSPQLHPPVNKLLHTLSYSHFDLLVDMDDEMKRAFYEIECIRGNWSVRELKRQINSLYYERSGLSFDKEKLAALANENAEIDTPNQTIRDPYVFEFLGLKPKEVMSESDLEDRLLDNLEEFLLELGHGFCFEARQKRILIGDEYNFVDLVFYHRILKCHVLIELKMAEFSHENIGQLNTYLNWYKKNEMCSGDKPPVGILLCTDRNHAMVEYALAGMDNSLFVSRYQVELPKKEEMQRFIEEKLEEMWK